MDYSPPGSSVHEIFQSRILEWVAISFSRGSSQPRDWTRVSCTAGRFFTDWATTCLYIIIPPRGEEFCKGEMRRSTLGKSRGVNKVGQKGSGFLRKQHWREKSKGLQAASVDRHGRRWGEGSVGGTEPLGFTLLCFPTFHTTRRTVSPPPGLSRCPLEALQSWACQQEALF